MDRQNTRFTEAEFVEFFRYLDDLREGGSTNMFGAAPFLADRFDMPVRDARRALKFWADTFSNEPATRRVEQAREAQATS